MYQQDIAQRRQRKDEYHLQEKQSDKQFIDEINRKNQEENMRRQMEKQRKINETKQEYNQFMIKKDEDRKNKFNKNIDFNINNYAINNTLTNPNSYDNNNNNMNFNRDGSNYNPNMRMDFDSKRDHLNPILNPDYIGIRKIEDLEKNKKMEVQKMYKGMLDAQMHMKPGNSRENSISLLELNKKNSNDNGFNRNPCKKLFIKDNSFFLIIL